MQSHTLPVFLVPGHILIYNIKGALILHGPLGPNSAAGSFKSPQETLKFRVPAERPHPAAGVGGCGRSPEGDGGSQGHSSIPSVLQSGVECKLQNLWSSDSKFSNAISPIPCLYEAESMNSAHKQSTGVVWNSGSILTISISTRLILNQKKLCLLNSNILS